jgi:hypothetical protein
MTHKERIKENIKKFDEGKWNKYNYASKYKCTLWTVENALNEVLMERLQKFKWENCTKGIPLDKHYFIEVPSVREITPKEIIELGNNKIQIILKSKIN